MTTQDWAISGGMPPELAAEQIKLRRRQTMAEALMEQAMRPLETNRMAGGYVVPVSPFEGAAKLLNTYVAGKRQKDVEKGYTDLSQKYQQGMADAVRQYMQTKQGAPASSETIVDETANDGEGAPATINAPAVKGDPRAAITQAMMSQFPQVRRFGQIEMTNLNRKEDRQDAQEFRAQEARLAREQRMQELQLRLQDSRLAAQDRANLQRELAQMQIDARRDMANMAASLRQPPAPIAVLGPDGKPVYADPRQAVGMQPWNKKEDVAKLPASALKLQQDEVEAMGIASTIKSDIEAIRQQIESGALKLGPVENLTSQARNFMGMSNENSQNFATFQATLEKMRNDSLRLNKGVQTEGDAVRAWNEIVKNANDPKVVAKRLAEVQRINERAVNLRRANVDLIRRNFGVGPLDDSGITNQPSATGAGTPGQPSAGGVAAPVPQGVDPKIWSAMTPEERALWK